MLAGLAMLWFHMKEHTNVFSVNAAKLRTKIVLCAGEQRKSGLINTVVSLKRLMLAMATRFALTLNTIGHCAVAVIGPMM